MKLKMVAIILLLPLMINLLVFESSDAVAGAKTIPATHVEVDADALVFDRLQTTRRITATVMPLLASNRKVSFETSNEDVAIVNELGDVTAISNGLAFITVTSDDGNHMTTVNIQVESFFIEDFVVTIDGSTDLKVDMFTESTLEIKVTVDPVEAMRDEMPFFMVNTSNTVSITAFENVSDETNKGEFVTTLTALRPASEIIVTIFITEQATGETHNRNIELNITNNTDDLMRFEFNGQRFNEDKPLVTANSIIPLQTSKVVPDQDPFFEIIDTYSSESVAQKVDGSLVFNRAGTVKLAFGAGEETATVEITSTYHKIIEDDLKQTLNDIGTIELSLGRTKQLTFDVNPFDFYDFYDVSWDHTEGIALIVSSDTNVLITAAQNLTDQYVTVTFKHKTTNEEIFHKFVVEISLFGVDTVVFELNNEQRFIRGLENTYVFGNTDYIGDNFNFVMITVATGPKDAMHLFDWTTSKEELATVSDSGTVTFISSFDGFDKSGVAYVTITATSKYPSLNNPEEYAMAEYTFIVRRGANVHDFNQYIAAKDNNKVDAIILRNNISFAVPSTTAVSLFGNGYTMDASELANIITDSTTTIFTFSNGQNLQGNNQTRISNVVFSGFADADINALRSRGNLVAINANTTLEYCKLEKAAILLSIRVDTDADGIRGANTDIYVGNNLFSFAGFAGAFLGTSFDEGRKAERIVFEDLIFENTLIGIVFEPSREQQKNLLGIFELTFKGTINFYNWKRVSELEEMSLTYAGQPIPLSNFTLETTLYNGEEYAQITIAILDVIDEKPTGDEYLARTRAAFADESNTAQRFGEVAARINFDDTQVVPKSGTDYKVFVSPTSYRIMGYAVRLTVHNPINGSRDYVSTEMQDMQIINPNYSLIIRQLNA